MTSSKQRRTQIQKRRAARSQRRAASRAPSERPAAWVAVNRAALAEINSYGAPDFVARGYYEDVPFRCSSCGTDEVWTATQQKWWYEVAKGFPYSTAKRCRTCRRRERARRAEARRVHREGKLRKQAR